MISSDQWTQINYYYELIRQEGDSGLELAFEALIKEVTHGYYNWFDEAKKAHAEAERYKQQIGPSSSG